MIRVADYVMLRLQQQAVKHLFMVTGRGMLFLSDAVAAQEQIQPICMHHEQACAYAAMGYAQANETLGVCMVSTGCASTNAITGTLCAWQDDVPCLFISGQNKLKETVRHTGLPIRTYGQQEADIIAMVEPITKYAAMIEHPEDIVYELEKALYLCQSGRKGPVWVDIPLDIQNMRIEPSELRQFEPPTTEIRSCESDLSLIQQSLSHAQRPVVLIGSGIRSAGVIDELTQFIESYQLPLVYGHAAVDVVDSSHSLSIGCVGSMAANRAANFAIQNADLVLVLGCRLTTYITGEKVEKFAREAQVIAVDIDPFEHQKFPSKVDHIIQADLRHFFSDVTEFQLKSVERSWVERCQQWNADYPKCEERFRTAGDVDIYELAEQLSHAIATDAICVTDSGLEEILIPTTMHFNTAQRCIHPASQGAMGFALPAAIGAYYASNRPVVAVIGDGSVMMNLQELQTIAHHQLPIKVLIVNNDCYAVIRKRQSELFRRRTVGTDALNGVSCPDFERVAGAFEMPYSRIDSAAELKENLQMTLQKEGALLCEIMAKPEQTYIHSSYRRGAKGRFVQPPIEDQSPFLEREEFLAQMIVKPIDL